MSTNTDLRCHTWFVGGLTMPCAQISLLTTILGVSGCLAAFAACTHDDSIGADSANATA
jgi:hypothetical protein